MTAKVPESAAPGIATGWAAAILFALLTLYCGFALFNASAPAFFRIPTNFNEGWNAYFARAAVDGVLYPSHDALITNNYPPLSFYLIGGLSRLGGDPIYIGRLLSGASLIGVAINIGAVLRILGVDRLMAAAVAVAFVGVIALGLSDYVASNDPQWLAHAVMATGVTGFLWGHPRRGAVAGAALVMLAAGLIKHNLLPAPIGVTLWLLLYDRAGLRVWLAASAAGLGAAAVLLWGLHGPDALGAILLTKRLYDPLHVVNALYQHVAPTIPLLVLVFACGVYGDRRARLVLYYAAIALVWDVYTMSAIGVAANGMLDYYIAVALLAGLALGRFAGTARVCAFVVVTLPVVVVAANQPKPHRVLESLRAHETAFAADVAFMRSLDGPAMCNSTALCYWAGKAFEYDPFNAVVRMNQDPAYKAGVVAKIRAKYFAVAQLYIRDNLPDEVAAAIDENYRIVHTNEAGWKYYRPK